MPPARDSSSGTPSRSTYGPVDGLRPADVDAVPRGRSGAAVGRRGEQVPPAVVLDGVGALELVVDGHLGGLADGLGAGLVELGDPQAAVVGAVEQVLGAVLGHDVVRVERPQVVVHRDAARVDDRVARVGPGADGRRRGRDADGVVEALGVRARLGDHVVEAVLAVDVADVGRPQGRADLGVGPGGDGRLGEGVADVLPAHQVRGAGDRQQVARPLTLAERVGGAVGVPPPVLAADDGRVGVGVGEAGSSPGWCRWEPAPAPLRCVLRRPTGRCPRGRGRGWWRPWWPGRNGVCSQVDPLWERSRRR